jgi:hypothetical protein
MTTTDAPGKPVACRRRRGEMGRRMGGWRGRMGRRMVGGGLDEKEDGRRRERDGRKDGRRGGGRVV